MLQAYQHDGSSGAREREMRRPQASQEKDGGRIRAAGSSFSPDSESRQSKESRTTQIGNPKPQENRHAHPTFLQNRLLAQVKLSRSINRFLILHGRLSSG